MSQSDKHPSDPDHELHEVDETLLNFPQYKPEYLFDDDECPQEVTIFSRDKDEISTHWLTASEAICWPLEDCR